MLFSLYMLLFINLIIFSLVIVFITLHKKIVIWNYSEEARNENDGRYKFALPNYEEVLREIRKLRLGNNLVQKSLKRTFYV